MQQLVKPQTASIRPSGLCFNSHQHPSRRQCILAPSQQQLQQQPCRVARLQARAAPKQAVGLDTSFLTENPIGKLLSGLVGTPVYVGMELVALLVMLGLTDAGYSGDWSRIGAITKEQELLLQQVAIIAWSLHGVCGLATAKIASSKGRNPAFAAVKGVLFGSLHVFEQLVLPPEGAQQGAAADARPARRR